MNRPERTEFAACTCLSAEENVAQGMGELHICGGCQEYDAAVLDWRRNRPEVATMVFSGRWSATWDDGDGDDCFGDE